MKIRAAYISLLLFAGLMSCNKDNFDYPPGTVGISKIIYFPSVTIKGDKIVAFTQGASYTDPGATAVLNGAPVQYTTNPTISSTTAPGIYTVTYTAKNAQGYTASDFRLVVVVSTAQAGNGSIAGNDFSGTYLRAATGVTSTWTKIANGVYTVENVGGAASGVGLIGIMYNTAGTTISMPSQSSPYYGGTISTQAGSESYTAGPPAKVSYIFLAPGYGTGQRTLVKQ